MGIVSDAAESAQREGVTTLLPSAAEQQAPFLPQGRVGAFHTHSLSTEALGTAAGKATAPAPAVMMRALSLAQAPGHAGNPHITCDR